MAGEGGGAGGKCYPNLHLPRQNSPGSSKSCWLSTSKPSPNMVFKTAWMQPPLHLHYCDPGHPVSPCITRGAPDRPLGFQPSPSYPLPTLHQQQRQWDGAMASCQEETMAGAWVQMAELGGDPGRYHGSIWSMRRERRRS